MGLLSRGQAFLNRALKATEGVAVTYGRRVGGVLYTVALTARHGRGMAYSRAEGVSGAAVLSSDRVFLIEAADLTLNGAPTTPMKDDRITEGGVGWVVAAPDDGSPMWQYSDPQTRTLYRVHTRRAP